MVGSSETMNWMGGKNLLGKLLETDKMTQPKLPPQRHTAQTYEKKYCGLCEKS